jgi:hypothetical protein
MNKIGTLLAVYPPTTYNNSIPIDDIYDKDLQPRIGVYYDSKVMLRYYKSVNIFGLTIVLETIEELML